MGQPTEFPKSVNSLTVHDNRTGKVYNIPSADCSPGAVRAAADIYDRIVDNSIPATAFKTIQAPRAPGEREENETEKGLRVSDKGFLNTAVLRSEITFIDGDAGSECLLFLFALLASLTRNSSSLQVLALHIWQPDHGVTLSRGYPIEQLALHSSHLETGSFHFYFISDLTKSPFQHIYSSTDHYPLSRNSKFSRPKSCTTA